MPEYYSNTPISSPVFHSKDEVVGMYGFAFTHKYGLVLQDSEGNSILDGESELLDVKIEQDIPEEIMRALENEEDISDEEDNRRR